MNSGFYFFVGDYMGERTLLVCSSAAEGVWVRLLARMHESPERGRLLTPAGTVPTRAEIAIDICRPLAVVEAALDELIVHKVCDVGADGAIECRKMRREALKHAAAAQEKARVHAAAVEARLASVNAHIAEIDKKERRAERNRRHYRAKKEAARQGDLFAGASYEASESASQASYQASDSSVSGVLQDVLNASAPSQKAPRGQRRTKIKTVDNATYPSLTQKSLLLPLAGEAETCGPRAPPAAQSGGARSGASAPADAAPRGLSKADNLRGLGVREQRAAALAALDVLRAAKAAGGGP